MQLWYSFVDYVLPFSFTSHFFMKNALLAVLIITPILGIMSTMVVNNKMAFFSDSIGHSALTGIGIGVLLGLKTPIWTMIVFAIIFAIFIVVIKRGNTMSTDTIIGVFSSAAISLGLVILSKGGGFQKYSYLLIGDLLSVSPNDIMLVFIVLILVIAFWIVAFNHLLVLSIHSSIAGSRGIRVFTIELLFTVVIAIIVTISIQWVGLLIINSLLILPGAGARNIAKNMGQYHLYSIAIAMISGIAGLILSYYWGSATGATITLISALIYFVTFSMKNKFI